MAEPQERRWQNIGARIREARLTAGLTQAQVARTLGVSAHTVWLWENGRMKPNHDHLVALATRYGVSTDRLLGREVVEAELLREAEVSFREAVEGLPTEDLESIWEFIRFVRERRRRQ